MIHVSKPIGNSSPRLFVWEKSSCLEFFWTKTILNTFNWESSKNKWKTFTYLKVASLRVTITSVGYFNGLNIPA